VAGFHFGMSAGANVPFRMLRERWRLVEDLGFDHLWVSDHTGSFAGGGASACFEGWTTLAAMACATRSIRIGTLVSNPVLRPPAVLAKQALTVDDLSEGRLELGIGTGIVEFDHAAVGEPFWAMPERLDRFAEYVDIVAAILADPGPVSRRGRYYDAATSASPPSVQRPRVPLTVGGQAPRVIEVAARHADRWNTHGPPGADLATIIERSRRQVARLDDAAASHGRDPATIIRSLAGVQALNIWTNDVSVVEIVEAFAPLGFSELILSWPGDDRLDELERLAADVLPSLRGATRP
jgi:alkanesulfonate monooxygenase SsuD/methylene tetrahydromethanopterin reductase-like flavin-dependent oxidoreductase (luciferase family)